MDNREHQGLRPCCAVVWAASHRSGAFPARTSCPKCKKDLSLTYHWPMPSNISILSQLPHLPFSGEKHKLQLAHGFMMFHVSSIRMSILCGVVTSDQPRCHGAASAALEGHRSVVPCLFGHNCSAQCYKRHVRDFNLDSCAVDNRGCEACFMWVRLAVDVCSVRMVIQIR